ncbi:MAG: type II toxin-antitoxin system RelE/ParE family toxin [Pseudomonadota bacterium]
MKVEITETARSDIIDILEWTIWNFGPQQALIYRDGLFNAFSLLEDNPRMGQVAFRLSADREIRRLIYRMHYIFYELTETEITVATIRHTRQTLPEDWER